MSKTKNKIARLTSFLYEIGTLRKIARSHRQALMTDDLSDKKATHSFRVAIIGWFLAKEKKADPYKVLLMCLFHDIPEARSGDQNWIHKKYVKVYEDEIIKDQLEGLPNNTELNQIQKEYSQRKTKEAKIAKAADLLDQIMLLKEHQLAGNSEAGDWLKGSQQRKKILEIMKTSDKFATDLSDEIINQKPHAWWRNVWTEKRR